MKYQLRLKFHPGAGCLFLTHWRPIQTSYCDARWQSVENMPETIAGKIQIRRTEYGNVAFMPELVKKPDQLLLFFCPNEIYFGVDGIYVTIRCRG